MAKKYRWGLAISSLDELNLRLRRGEWVYLGNKVMHPSFMLNMQFRTVSGTLAYRNIFKAIQKEQ